MKAEALAKMLAESGISISVVSGELVLSPDENTEKNRKAIEKILANDQSVASLVGYYQSQESYPYLTRREAEMGFLMIDLLDTEELSKLAVACAAYGLKMPQDADDTSYLHSNAGSKAARVPGRTRGKSREYHPEGHLTPDDLAAARIEERLARIQRRGQKLEAEFAKWTFDPSPEVKWVRRCNAKGQYSFHIISSPDGMSAPACDCQGKFFLPDEECVHEMGRAWEIERRGPISE